MRLRLRVVVRIVAEELELGRVVWLCGTVSWVALRVRLGSVCEWKRTGPGV